MRKYSRFLFYAMFMNIALSCSYFNSKEDALKDLNELVLDIEMSMESLKIEDVLEYNKKMDKIKSSDLEKYKTEFTEKENKMIAVLYKRYEEISSKIIANDLISNIQDIIENVEQEKSKLNELKFNHFDSLINNYNKDLLDKYRDHCTYENLEKINKIKGKYELIKLKHYGNDVKNKLIDTWQQGVNMAKEVLED